MSRLKKIWMSVAVLFFASVVVAVQGAQPAAVGHELTRVEMAAIVAGDFSWTICSHAFTFQCCCFHAGGNIWDSCEKAGTPAGFCTTTSTTCCNGFTESCGVKLGASTPTPLPGCTCPFTNPCKCDGSGQCCAGLLPKPGVPCGKTYAECSVVENWHCP